MSVDDERLRRWRLVLGGEDGQDGTGFELEGEDQAIDGALSALYRGQSAQRKGGLGASAPNVARWLGDIRQYFPSSVVQVMQADAIERLNLTQLLVEPEMLQAVEPDINLVGTLLSLNKVLPEKARSTARQVVAKVVADLERKVAQRTRAAV